MRHRKIGELPNIDDPTIKEFGLRIQKMRSVLLKTTTSLLAQNAQARKASPMIVVFGVLHRMAECALSIELLASKGLFRDAATLLLTLVELRLDLQFISRSPGRDEQWLKHTKKETKSWKVGLQIKEIFTNPSERNSEFANYRLFSMAKHGNPAGEYASFPFGLREDSLILPAFDLNLRLLPVWLFGVGSSIYQAAVAGGKIVHSVGFDMRAEIEQLRILHTELSQLLEKHTRAMIQRDMQEQSNPTA
jgi:hypothetical protein